MKFGFLSLAASLILLFYQGCTFTEVNDETNNDSSVLTRRVKACIDKADACLALKPDSGYHYLTEGLKIADENGLAREKPAIFLKLASIYTSVYDYRMAVVMLDSARRIASAYQDYENLSNALNDLGNAKFELRDFANARKMFDTAYKTASAHAMKKQMGVALGSLARFEENSAVSIRMYKEAIELLKQSPGTGKAIALLLINTGLRCENSDNAIGYYRQAVATIGNRNEVYPKIVAYNNLACSFMEKKDYRQADSCLVDLAIPMAEKSGNPDWLATLFDTYTDLLLAEGKYREAAMAGKKAMEYLEASHDLKATGQVRLLTTLLDVKNTELRLKTTAQELEKNTNRINVLIILFIAVTLLLTLIILWILQRNKFKTEKQKLASAQKIIALEEGMKERLAMELHDLTSPLYMDLIRQVDEVELPDNGIKQELRAGLTALADRIRKISHKMSGLFIGQLTFREIVSGFCEEMQGRSGATITVTFYNGEPAIQPEQASHIIRIIQELITNGVKYVSHGTISLAVSSGSGGLSILYDDAGEGFDMTAKSRTGLGLTSIVERARLLGASAILDTSPGKGVHWRIFVPINDHKPKSV